MTLGVWVVAMSSAVLLAVQLDRPVGEAGPDAAQPVAGDIAVPEPGAGLRADLPPLGMLLDTPLRAGSGGLAATEQLRRLRVEARLTGDPEVLVQLGALNQRLGGYPAAAAAFESALRLDAGNVAARVGLAMNEGARAPAGLGRAADSLGSLARSHPDSQLVALNEGWLALYRGEDAVARRAWRRAAALGPATPLGTLARGLLDAAGEPGSRARP